MHGYELAYEYQRQMVENWAAVSASHMYYSLRKLEKWEMLATTSEHHGDRERIVYSVTPSGQAALANVVADLGWATTIQPAPFLSWMGLSVHAPAEYKSRVIAVRRVFVRAEIDRQQVSLKELYADESPRAHNAKAIARLMILQYKTELNWLDEIDTAGL